MPAHKPRQNRLAQRSALLRPHPTAPRAAASARERRPLAAPTNRKATAASTRGDARETATIVDAAGASS